MKDKNKTTAPAAGKGKDPTGKAAWAANVLLVLGSVTVALVAAELILPLFRIHTLDEAVYHVRRPVIQYLFVEFDPVRRYTLKKNDRIRLTYPGQLDYTVVTNSYGLRGGAWDLSPTRKNICVLGDSFAFGWGVQEEQTVGRVLEEKLRRHDPAYQVINLATPGYSMREIVKTLEIFRPLLNPVAVVYVYCPNDLESRPPPVAPGRYDLEYHPQPGDPAVYEDLMRRNRPEVFSWYRLYRGSYLKAVHARLFRPIFSKRIRASLEKEPAPAGYDFPPPLATVTPPLDRPEADYLRYGLDRLMADTRPGRLYLLDTSDRYLLFKRDKPESDRWLLRKYCDETPGATCVDFETAVRKTPGSRRYFQDLDDHWSAAGHAFAADLLYGAMKGTLPVSGEASAGKTGP
jgi:lysophospholipase L1-like esterase